MRLSEIRYVWAAMKYHKWRLALLRLAKTVGVRQ